MKVNVNFKQLFLEQNGVEVFLVTSELDPKTRSNRINLADYIESKSIIEFKKFMKPRMKQEKAKVVSFTAIQKKSFQAIVIVYPDKINTITLE